MQWYLKVVRDNYANFNGRAHRQEFWMFTLFHVIFLIIAAVADNVIGTTFTFAAGTDYETNAAYGWIYVLYGVAVLVPGWALWWRRLHDIGKSGAWFFLALVPLVGGVVLIIWACKDSNGTENKYGPSPKG